MIKRTVELRHTSGHFKFWSAEGPFQTATGGYRVETAWGRIGTSGQTLTKHFASQFSARAFIESMVESKRAKGYSAYLDKQVEQPEIPIAPPPPPGWPGVPAFVPKPQAFAQPPPPAPAAPPPKPPPPPAPPEPPAPSDLDAFDFMMF